MKSPLKKFLCLVLIFALLTGFASAAAVHTSETALADSAALEHITNKTASAVTQEHIVAFSPSSELTPIVAYGSTLYGRSTMQSVINNYLTPAGLTAVAGINGAFFDLSDGIPYGLVVTDGILRSSGNIHSVGFFADGSAILGKPELNISLSASTGYTTAGLSYNKALTIASGLVLYSQDYDYATKSEIATYDVILAPADGQDAQLTMSGRLDLTVRGGSSMYSCTIPDGCFVLSIAEDTPYTGALAALEALNEGDTVTVETTCADSWKNVRYACGGGEMLVENGIANTSFTLDSANNTRARTAIGLKADGSVLLYTADESSLSDGMTLSALAARLAELGCVTALNLDGGGSTAVGATYPGDSKNSTVNRPSDGSLRKCANFIFLVRETKAAGSASKLFVYPSSDTLVLPNAKISLSTKATDKNYMPVSISDGITYETSNGSLSSSTLTIDADATGSATVKAKSANLSSSVTYTIPSTLTSIYAYNSSRTATLSSLTVASGSKTQLHASGYYYGNAVSSADNSFTWSCSEAIGTISQDGIFTAAETSEQVSGTITISYGSAQKVISVTVLSGNPFADTKGHWAADYITSLYTSGVLAGSKAADGSLLFHPDDNMTRQEFAVALCRYLNVDTSLYSNTELPFADCNDVASWARDAVSAAYQLGYIKGSSGANGLLFNPTSSISRQEAMVILSRTLAPEATDLSVLSQFSDRAQIATWAEDALAAMVQRGIVGGSGGKVNPTGSITRAEIAKILCMMQSL